MKNIFANYWQVILGAVILILILSFFIGKLQMDRKISNEKKSLLGNSNQINIEEESSIINQRDLESLPIPVKKWLENVGLPGQKKIRSVNFSQKGKMKLNPRQKNWYKPEARQYVRVDKPGYLWEVNIPMVPLVNVRGRDYLNNGNGFMEIRIASLIRIVNVKDNKKINESSLHRFLMELPWYPTAAIEDYITWEGINKTTAKAILTYKEISVKSKFYFNDNGELQKIESLRYKDSGAKAKRIPCIGEIKEYITVDGLKIPNSIDVTWILDQEPFTWYKLTNYNIIFQRK